MLEYMVEYGRQGVVWNGNEEHSDSISHLEIYKLSTLTKEELTALMYYLRVDKSTYTNQPLESMSSDEMRMEYIRFRKSRIEKVDERISKYIDGRKMKQLKLDLYISKILNVFKYY